MTTQATISGTAPITDGELAQRRASLPLKPAAPQKPCNVDRMKFPYRESQNLEDAGLI